jgi:hypothetical protein
MKKHILGVAFALTLYLGLAAPSFAAEPVNVPLMTASVETSLFSIWSGPSSDYYGGFVLKSDGELWAYLSDKSGSPGKLESNKVLTDVVAVTSTVHSYVVAITTGTTTLPTVSTALALKTDGALYVCAFGWNYGESEPFFVSKQVDSNVARIGGTTYLKTNGELYALDPASKTSSNAYEASDVISFLPESPTYITSDHTLHINGAEYPGFQKIFSGPLAQGSFALNDDGSLYGWGNNSRGSVGAGAVYDEIRYGTAISGGPIPKRAMINSPMPVLERVDTMFFDENCVYARDSAGSLWQWGDPPSPEKYGDDVWTQLPPAEYCSPRLSAIKQPPQYKQVNGIIIQTDGTLMLRNTESDGTVLETGLPVKLSDVLGAQETVAAPAEPATPAAPAAPAANTVTAKPTASRVVVDGQNLSFDAYNINGNNYFKLRDLAYALSGSQKQFDVGWDGAANAITLMSGKAYTAVGGEMASKGAGDKTATPTSSKITLNGGEVSLTAYNIGGNNYFKLRDIAQVFDFGVFWDGDNNMIFINAGNSYTPE